MPYMRQTFVKEYYMNELELLRKELQEVTNKQIRLETIKEQAIQQCKEIEDKYGIHNEQELRNLLEKAEQEYNKNLEQAAIYLADAKQAFEPFEGLL